MIEKIIGSGVGPDHIVSLGFEGSPEVHYGTVRETGPEENLTGVQAEQSGSAQVWLLRDAGGKEAVSSGTRERPDSEIARFAPIIDNTLDNTVESATGSVSPARNSSAQFPPEQGILREDSFLAGLSSPTPFSMGRSEGRSEIQESDFSANPSMPPFSALGISSETGPLTAADMANEIRIADFAEVEEIGRGGFGVVYRAVQTTFDRVVAVKLLLTVLDRRSWKRFERERRALGTLSTHPNIVTMYDTGMTSVGRPFLVMEYLSGGSLSDRVALERCVQWPEVLRIGVKISGALATVHAAGVLHRDVKPANILVSEFYEPQLCDFGIATLPGLPETQTTTVFASVWHAAPEVVAGQRPTVASDVYSLGSTLFELLWGSPAFLRSEQDSMVALVHRIAYESLPDLRSCGVPEPVWQVIEQAMAKNPGQRQSSVAQLGRDLQRAQVLCGLTATEMKVSPEKLFGGQERGSLAGDGLQAGGAGQAAAGEGNPLRLCSPVAETQSKFLTFRQFFSVDSPLFAFFARWWATCFHKGRLWSRPGTPVAAETHANVETGTVRNWGQEFTRWKDGLRNLGTGRTFLLILPVVVLSFLVGLAVFRGGEDSSEGKVSANLVESLSERENGWYVNRRKGVRFRYPSEWRLDESGSARVAEFFAPAELSEKFPTSVNLTIGEGGLSRYSIEEITNKTREGIERQIKGVEFLPTEETRLGSLPAVVLNFTHPRGGVVLRQRQVLALDSDAILYVFTLKVPLSEFSGVRNKFDLFVGSFTRLEKS